MIVAVDERLLNDRERDEAVQLAVVSGALSDNRDIRLHPPRQSRLSWNAAKIPQSAPPSGCFVAGALEIPMECFWHGRRLLIPQN
jgi:hypothetical protein